MKDLSKLSSFSLYGTGSITVDGYGHIEVDGKNLGKVVAEHIGLELDNYKDAEFYGVVTLKITPYQHKELGIIDEF